MDVLPKHLLARLVAEALREDIGPGDLTCEGVVPESARAVGVISAGGRLVVAGLDAARSAFAMLDPAIRMTAPAPEGSWLEEGAVALEVEGDARGILTAERTALNFLGRMSGIATLTRRCVEAVAGTRASIYDTRKTTPGLRPLERYAVSVGGGRNHRFGLFDALLIKDNHLIASGGVTAAIEAARRRFGSRYPIEVEVESIEDLGRAIDAGADIILLDNMTVETMSAAVALRDSRTGASGHPLLEASGGIGADSVRAVAATGVDRISMGALTHSAPSAGFSLTLRRREG